MSTPMPPAYDGPNPYIFVSYSHDDSSIVIPFIVALQEKYNVWYDSGISTGDVWRDVILDKLQGCSLFLFMVSENSQESKYCKREALFADDKGKTFCNVVLRGDTYLGDWFHMYFWDYQFCYLDRYASPAEAVARISTESSRDIVEQFTRVKKDDPDVVAEGYFRTASDFYRAADYEKAAYWDKRAADLGHAEAQFCLAQLYEQGKGVSKDLPKAFEYYQRAAVQGNAKAQYALGRCYEYGNGVERNHQRAFVWYKNAAEARNAAAQYKVGLFYEQGKGVAKSEAEALRWYQMAADGGNADARNRLSTGSTTGSDGAHDASRDARTTSSSDSSSFSSSGTSSSGDSSAFSSFSSDGSASTETGSSAADASSGGTSGDHPRINIPAGFWQHVPKFLIAILVTAAALGLILGTTRDALSDEGWLHLYGSLVGLAISGLGVFAFFRYKRLVPLRIARVLVGVVNGFMGIFLANDYAIAFYWIQCFLLASTVATFFYCLHAKHKVGIVLDAIAFLLSIICIIIIAVNS